MWDELIGSTSSFACISDEWNPMSYVTNRNESSVFLVLFRMQRCIFELIQMLCSRRHLSLQLPTVAFLILPLCWSRSEPKFQVGTHMTKKIFRQMCSPGRPKKHISKVERLDLSNEQVVQNWRKKPRRHASSKLWPILADMKMSFTFSSFFLLIVSRARLTDTVGADWEKLKKRFHHGARRWQCIIDEQWAMINDWWWLMISHNDHDQPTVMRIIIIGSGDDNDHGNMQWWLRCIPNARSTLWPETWRFWRFGRLWWLLGAWLVALWVLRRPVGHRAHWKLDSVSVGCRSLVGMLARCKRRNATL